MVRPAHPSVAAFVVAEFPSLLQSLGAPEFLLKLLQALERLVSVRHLAIVTFDDRLIPHVVATESIGRSQIAKSAGKIYEESLYRHDPNIRLIRSQPAMAPADEAPLLLRVKASEIDDREYRSKIYRRFGLVDRFSILDHSNRLTGDRWQAINLFRDRRAGEFTRREVMLVESLARLIATVVAKHFALLPGLAEPAPLRPSVELFERRVTALDSRLTARQIQVCARALMGMTNAAVGLDLGIRVPTVATLRKRAYATLGISSLNELFALCLVKTTLTQPSPWNGEG
jgi:DNA-binding CsgD family transcriptional regulator